MSFRDLKTIFIGKPREVSDYGGPKTGKDQDFSGSVAFGGLQAGELVTEESSLTIAAVFSAVRLLSEDVASLPLHLYVREEGGRRRATWRQEYKLLHSEPNGYQSAFSLREAMMASLLLRGNAYCEIERSGNGEAKALHFIPPQTVSTKMVDGEIRHFVGKQKLDPSEVFHVHAFSTDGISGRGVITLARQTIGLTKATESFGANYFGNGATPGGLLTPQKPLKQEQVDRLREGWNEIHQGPKRAGGVAVLEPGMAYEKIGIPPEDSQFLETRKFQVTEIARWFRTPPHMLGDLEKATFSNIEHQGLEYVTHTLRPWLVRIEQEAMRQLLPPGVRGPYYFEHLVDGFLRGDIANRYKAYAIGRQWGWLSANDIRRLENMNRIEGGDEYLVPLNMTGGDDERDTDTRTDVVQR